MRKQIMTMYKYLSTHKLGLYNFLNQCVIVSNLNSN